MQQVYQNRYKEIRVRELYEDFKVKGYNHPILFTDKIVVTTDLLRTYSTNWFPIEYITKPVLTKYTNEAAYASNTGSALVEGTHYTIDYDRWVVVLLPALTIANENIIELVGYYTKINLRQFIVILNSALRTLDKYYPSKGLIEYTGTDAGLDQSVPQEITEINTTWLPFTDINACYKEKSSKLPLKFHRRGEYIFFDNSKPQTISYELTVSDYWLSESPSTSQELPIWIEGNLKPGYITWNDADTEGVLGTTFLFNDIGYEALLLMLEIDMYMLRLNYNESHNVMTLKMNTMGIYAILREQKGRLASYVMDSTISKWFYPAWEAKGMNNVLSPTLG